MSRVNIPKNYETIEQTLGRRFLPKSLALVVALLIVSQVIAVTVESQAAALLSWYLIYALLILIPLTLLYEGFERYYPDSSSEKSLLN